MTSTGTYIGSMENADIISDAYERIGKDPDSMVQRHIESALRSMNFMFVDWGTKGVAQYRVETLALTSADGYVAGAQTVTLPAQVIRTLHVVNRDADDVDTALLQIGRIDYDYLVKKDQVGNRPDRYFLDRARDAPVLTLWPVPDNSNQTLLVTSLVKIQDAGELSNTPDVGELWLEAVAAGLAAKLAEKYAPERLAEKRTLAKEAFDSARANDRETGPTKFRMRGYAGRRR